MSNTTFFQFFKTSALLSITASFFSTVSLASAVVIVLGAIFAGWSWGWLGISAIGLALSFALVLVLVVKFFAQVDKMEKESEISRKGIFSIYSVM